MAKRSEKSIYKAMLIDGILEWSCKYTKDKLEIKTIRQLENIYDMCWETERRSGI
jgi:hypothetical protein